MTASDPLFPLTDAVLAVVAAAQPFVETANISETRRRLKVAVAGLRRVHAATALPFRVLALGETSFSSLPEAFTEAVRLARTAGLPWQDIAAIVNTVRESTPERGG
ncbi:MAG: hypothetical protein HQL34_10195 [Alphaproteobacteria bacterium]|nr:hypothetical protein [Alphaproteobacteria bacterium]